MGLLFYDFPCYNLPSTFKDMLMRSEDLSNLPVVNQAVVCHKSEDGKWSFDSMLNSVDKNLSLSTLADNFREEFMKAMSAMSERSEVRAFKAAYDLLSRRLGDCREKVFSAHVFIKYVGSDRGINIANNGTIYVMKIGASMESIISKNPPRGFAMPPTVDNPQLNWEPIEEGDVCLVVYNYAASRLLGPRKVEMAKRIRLAKDMEIAEAMLDSEISSLPLDRGLGHPNFLLIPLR